MHRRLHPRPDLEFYRKEAKSLVRAWAAAAPGARARAERVTRRRGADRFSLSDAQRLIALEHGYARWSAFRRAIERVAADPEAPDELQAALTAARREWGELGEIVLETGESYRAGEPVRLLVRKRGRRYDLGDMAQAVERAGRPSGWFQAARTVVDRHALNVNRRGVVFVSAVEGRDLASLARQLGEASLAVYVELLELES